MTLEEKLAQLGSTEMAALPLQAAELDSELAAELFAEGIGNISCHLASETTNPAERALIANSVQHWLQRNTRLGIPALWVQPGFRRPLDSLPPLRPRRYAPWPVSSVVNCAPLVLGSRLLRR